MSSIFNITDDISFKFNPNRDSFIDLCKVTADNLDFYGSPGEFIDDICYSINKYFSLINTAEDWQFAAVLRTFPRCAISLNISSKLDSVWTFTVATVNLSYVESAEAFEFSPAEQGFIADSELDISTAPLTKVFDSAISFGIESMSRDITTLDAIDEASASLEQNIITLECACKYIYEGANNYATHSAIRSIICKHNLRYLGYLAQDLVYLNMQVKV